MYTVSTVACTKEDAKKEEQNIKDIATVPKKEEKKKSANLQPYDCRLADILLIQILESFIIQLVVVLRG